MALDGTDLTPPGEDDDAPAMAPAHAAPIAPASIALTSDLVRNSPEFRALQEQNRTLARQAGSANAAIAAARQEAEQVRQAAEAERATAMAQQLRSTLGDDGLAFWNQLSELSATDPMAAARALAEWKGVGQTPPAAATPPPVPAPQEVRRPEPNAPAQSNLHADSPLGSPSPQESDEEQIAAFEKKIVELEDRNLNPMTRSRVTTKERDEGIMALFAKGVVAQLGGRSRK